MSLAQALSSYINLNVLVAMGLIGLSLFAWLQKSFKRQLPSKFELELHYAVLAGILLLSVIHPFLPKSEIFKPAAKVWSAQSMKTFSQDFSPIDRGGYLSVPTMAGNKTVNADNVSALWFVIALSLGIAGVIHIGGDLRSILRVKRKSYLVRRWGRTYIYVNDEIKVPFSYWLPGQANVILPTHLLTQKTDYQMAIAHELQHHRHGDTKWIYVMWGLRLLCIANPFVHLWNRWLSEIQEFACDETLVDQRKVESQAYARCLVEVAQTASEQKFVPRCATGLIFLSERNFLKRRIEKMISTSTRKLGRSISVSVGLGLATLMAVTAYASNGLVQDRRVTMAQAQSMVLKARGKSDFPVVVNDRVLIQLNRYIGTPEGREFMRVALQRMNSHQSLVERKMAEYDVPFEIAAIPIVESGYRNLTEAENRATSAAGMWQFIPSTARKYGMRVGGGTDDRNTAEIETDAAMRYLKSNFLQFKDWQLAILGYNYGEGAVQKAMMATGSRDAWTLIKRGYEGDKDYLAKVMAAVLIAKNPESVD